MTCDFAADGCRLPTEAEWEYAARGGAAGRGYRYAGGDDPDAVAWYALNSGGAARPAGEKQPNELGLYDMPGNLWERCGDRLGPYDTEPRTDPRGPDAGAYRVIRGGCWSSPENALRPAGRFGVGALFMSGVLGFRVVRPGP